jgi:pyridoxamine 5'-phosphate oxidase
MPDGPDAAASAVLNEGDADPDPLRQFDRWFHEALEASRADAHAMTVATATPDGQPSARMVLLKDYDARGFVFYTNYESRKGQELAANPFVALVFYWPELHRQVRVTGRATHVPADESDAYFRSRELGSRVGAWASPQSRMVDSRQELDRRFAALMEQYQDGEVPRPPHWGGVRVVPEVIEFWQGRANRLHDRLRYTLDRDGAWRIERLAP